MLLVWFSVSNCGLTMNSYDIEQQIRNAFAYVFFTLNTQDCGAPVVDLQGLCTNMRRVCKEMGIVLKPWQGSKYTDGDYMDFETFMTSIEESILRNLDASAEDCYEIERFMWQTSCRDHYQLLKGSISAFTEDDAFMMWRIFNCLSTKATVGEAEIATIVDRFVDSVGVRINGFIRAKKQCSGGGVQFFPMLEQICASIPDNVEDKVIGLIIRRISDELLGQVIKCGMLSKKGHLRHSWKERWCILRPGVLKYYTDENLTEQKGAICINGASRVEGIENKSGHHFRFLLVCGKTGKMFEIEAPTEIERVEWIQSIKSVMRSDGRCPILTEILERKKGNFESLWGSPNHQNGSNSEQFGRFSMDARASHETSSSSSDSESEVFVNDRSASVTFPLDSSGGVDLAAKIQELKAQHEKLRLGLANLELDYKRDRGKKIKST